MLTTNQHPEMVNVIKLHFITQKIQNARSIADLSVTPLSWSCYSILLLFLHPSGHYTTTPKVDFKYVNIADQSSAKGTEKREGRVPADGRSNMWNIQWLTGINIIWLFMQSHQITSSPCALYLIRHSCLRFMSHNNSLVISEWYKYLTQPFLCELPFVYVHMKRFLIVSIRFIISVKRRHICCQQNQARIRRRNISSYSLSSKVNKRI